MKYFTHISSNKGMYLEEIISRTISYYADKSIAYFEKRHIPFKILNMLDQKKFIGQICSKSTVDYTGNYMGRHIEFEAKQTINSAFSLNSIKEHQLSFLIAAKNKFNTLCFLIVHFYKLNKYYLITIDEILKYVKEKSKKTISEKDIETIGYELTIVFPGILNLIETIKKII